MNARLIRLMAVPLAALMTIAGALTPAAAAEPDLKLIAASDRVELVRWGPGQRVWLDLGVHVGAVGSRFQINVRRDAFDAPFQVTQVFEDGSTRTLPPNSVRAFLRGFHKFFDVVIKRTDGSVIERRTASFCPNGWDVIRVERGAPDTQPFPYDCGHGPLTMGMVWGIEDGWATSVPMGSARLSNGKYIFRIFVKPRFVEMFGITDADARVRATVTTERWGYKLDARDDGGPGRAGSMSAPDPEPSEEEIPGIDSRPDLRVSPAFAIELRNEFGRDYLAFGADVWNAGPSNLVVDGYRKKGEALMEAYQSFYKDGVKVGTAEAGTLIYDPRPGHQHWHFQDFAMYRLLDADQNHVLTSGKEAFCLAPTDAIDLTLSGAVWRPDSIGFGSACGSQGSLSIREVLQTGWGDTYHQWVPGQSFDVTDVPNGTYFIQVEANVDGRLYEVTTDNNTSLRQLTLGGTTGNRTVIVEPYQGRNF